ncbi:MAG: family phosphatase [Bryobacterales bacterium]|nr:family phosphatase [Bryobacterales bacterium]
MISKNTPDLDYSRLARAGRKLVTKGSNQNARIAILSDAATQQFVPLLKALFHDNGVNAEIYEGAFDAIEMETFDRSSGLYQFQPGVVVLANCAQALRSRYYQHGGAGFPEAATERMLRIWDALGRHCAACVVQCNYPLPYERQFGNYDLKVAHSLYASVAAINMNIAQCVRERANVLVCDVEGIASYAGRKNWYDDRLWNMTKAFCQLDHLPQVAQALVEMTLPTMGRVVKCVVLDLDNTLWGGVVGDDGPLGISIGAHGDGEAFFHFQHYLLSLKRRGILLAVCSKNDHENAVRPFVENPEMVLKRQDITMFVVNWENKADNIRKIRDTLEIGLDSMVFLDDNPFERNLVRQFLPDVIVPEMPEDPADYVRAISELNLFETSSFSAEDLARSELYKQEAGRREVQSTYSNIDEYLRSLEMQIEVARFHKAKIPRIAQLIQRSNQFNLTTHRYNEGDCEKMMLDTEGCVPLYASLRDRFGDHGLISIVILRIKPDVLEIGDWLMSCRVLARGVEHFLMTRVVELAREKGLTRITGEYIPTAKNAMVKDFFAQFGFEKTAEQDGASKWHLDPAPYQARTIYITEGD